MKLTVFLPLLFFQLLAFSQAGSLDFSFGMEGRVTTSVPGAQMSYANSVNFQSDGKIVVSGTNTSSESFTLIRYLVNGSIDSAFALNGVLKTTLGFNGIGSCKSSVIQADDKILVAGTALGNTYQEPVIARFLPNGETDSSFAQNGIVHINSGILFEVIHQLKIQADGKILALGSCSDLGYDKVLLYRFHPNGALDQSFAENGRLMYSEEVESNGYGSSLDLSTDGKIIFAYQYTLQNSMNRTSLVRLNQDGSLDTSFGMNGKIRMDFPEFYYFRRTNIELTTEDKIILVHSTNTSNYMYRYNSDGSLDSGFGTNGMITSDFGKSDDFVLQQDNKIILLKYTYQGSRDFIVTRLLQNGSVDSTFGNSGTSIIDFDNADEFGYAVNVQANGKIVAVGISGGNLALIRLLNDRVSSAQVQTMDNEWVKMSCELMTNGVNLTIEFTDYLLQDSKLHMFDALGKEVFQTDLQAKNKIPFHEKSGIYFYYIQNPANGSIFQGNIIIP